MKFPKPFYRKSKQSWYLQIGRRQFSLGTCEEEALKRYKEILLHEEGNTVQTGKPLHVEEVCDLYLEWSKRHNDPETYQWNQTYLQSFCDLHGGRKVTDLKPFHVTKWLDAHPRWRPATRRTVVGAIKRVFNWCETEGYLAVNPLKAVKKEPRQRRERTLTVEERQHILGAARGKAFREFLHALQETGCRPSEIRKVTAANVHFEAAVWLFRHHKTSKKTGRPRVVYLTPAMLDLTRKLVERNPQGPLFRNSRGLPWTRNAIRCRFRNLRKKLAHLSGVVAYTYRHSFVTDALVNGVGIAQVAELCGHASVETVSQVYQHLAERRDHLLGAVRTATANLQTSETSHK